MLSCEFLYVRKTSFIKCAIVQLRVITCNFADINKSLQFNEFSGRRSQDIV